MIDFHSHIIPNIDDGSKNEDETIELLKEAEEVGFDGVILTSHYIENYYEKNEEERKNLIKIIENDINENGINIDLYIGNENYISNNLVNLLSEKKASTINNTKYVLFEMPLTIEEKPMELTNIVYSLQGNGYIPIIAHPERYKFVQKNPEIVLDLVNMDVLMQGNYGSILGQYGKKAEAIIEILLKNSLIHFLGSDVHKSNTVYKNIPEALKKIEKIIGKRKLDELTTTNPELVINNNDIDIDFPEKLKISFKDRLFKFN